MEVRSTVGKQVGADVGVCVDIAAGFFVGGFVTHLGFDFDVGIRVGRRRFEGKNVGLDQISVGSTVGK